MTKGTPSEVHAYAHILNESTNKKRILKTTNLHPARMSPNETNCRTIRRYKTRKYSEN